MPCRCSGLRVCLLMFYVPVLCEMDTGISRHDDLSVARLHL